MKRRIPYLSALVFLFMAGLSILDSLKCTNPNGEAQPLSHDQMVLRGKYLVQISGCGDCHSPKIMTAHGPAEDTTRLLAGHFADMPLFRVDTAAKGSFFQASPDLTAWAGPWGVSFSANLTPDEKTGLGGWTDDIFIRTLRTGKYQGIGTGRDLLPPMPWQNLSRMTDEDLRSIFVYLQSIPAISNAVAPPILPNQTGATK